MLYVLPRWWRPECPTPPRRMQASMRVLWLCEHKLCLRRRPLSFPGHSKLVSTRGALSVSRTKGTIASVPCLWWRVVVKVSRLKLLTQNRRQYMLSLLRAVQTSCWDQLGSSTVERHHSSPRLLPWPVPRSCIAWVHGWWNGSRTRGRQLNTWRGATQLHLCAVDLLPEVEQAAGAPPILGQLYLPRESYILSAEAGRVVRQALESATWGKEFGRDEEVRRRPARAVLSLLVRACKGPGQCGASLPIDGLVAALRRAQSL